jgi:hypothetical protein
MGLFDKFFKRTEIKQTDTKKYLSEIEMEQRNKAFLVKFEQVKNLFISSLKIYNLESCQCAYPRFQQVIGIDCTDTSNSFKCYDTDLLIDLSKSYFNIEKSELNDECTNEKWTCKKCSSTYEYGWSDFSIHVERQKLKLQTLQANTRGKEIIMPIPLFLGLMGHSYPPKTEMTNVGFKDFENYMTEK